MLQELKFQLSTAVLTVLTIGAAIGAALNYQQLHRFPLPDEAEKRFLYTGSGSWESTRTSSPARGWRRMFHVHADRMGQKIPPLDALEDEVDKRVAAGESDEDVTIAVIEDFEKSAATVNARTTPLVPASGIVVTGAGILAKAGNESDAATILAFVAVAFALIGLGILILVIVIL